MQIDLNGRLNQDTLLRVEMARRAAVLSARLSYVVEIMRLEFVPEYKLFGGTLK